MLEGGPSLFYVSKTLKEQILCLQDTKRAHFMYLILKNQDSVFSENRIAYFKKYIQNDPTPDFGLLVKFFDGKCNNSPLMNSCLNFEQANIN